MKKKLLAVLLLVAMAATMMFSCGTQKAIPNFEVPENGYDGSEVTIRFYHTMGSNLTAVLDTYIEEFNKLYPNIHIEYDSVGGYDDVKNQIGTEIGVGDQPNIAYCYADHVALYNLAGAVATLDNLIESDIKVTRADGTTEILGLTKEQKDDFIEGYYKEGAQFGDGLMYTLPFSKSTEVLYYNKTFFDKYELEVPTTWEEMEALCKRILEIDKNCIPLGYDSEANWFITMCEQYGSEYTSTEKGRNFLFNNDTNKSFVKYFRSWYQKGYLTTQEIYGGYTSGLFTNMDNTKKNSYMSIGSTGGSTHQRPDQVDGEYPFEVGIAPIPQVDPDNPKVISQGPSLCIFDSDNKQEVVASWLFVKFLTTDAAFQAEFSMTSGYMPVIQSVNTIEQYANFINNANGTSNISALAVKVGNEQKDAYYVSPAFNGSSVARDQVGALLQYCFTVTAKDDNELNTLIDEEFKKAVKYCRENQ